jgi:hypothetical protein
MSEHALRTPAAFLEQLEEAHIQYTLACHREGVGMVLVTVPGERLPGCSVATDDHACAVAPMSCSNAAPLPMRLVDDWPTTRSDQRAALELSLPDVVR